MHKIYKITNFEIPGTYTLKIYFDDNTIQIINFKPVLKGKIYGALLNKSVFEGVKLDSEINNLVWPNDADFDTETLHDWDLYKDEIALMTEKFQFA